MSEQPLTPFEKMRDKFAELTDLENQFLQILNLMQSGKMNIASRTITLDTITKNSFKTELLKIKDEMLTKMKEVKIEVDNYT